MKKSIYILLFFILLITNSFSQTITNTGNVFNPDTLLVNINDTITFNISINHNAVEVDESIYLANGTTSNNGFNINYGGGSWIVDSIKTYYYVCQPHAGISMKGIIISSENACNKSLVQDLKGFSPNPVNDYWIWSYDTLSLTNTSNCDVRVRPEFDISHEGLQIDQNDFDLKWYNPYIGNWIPIPYSIDPNGNAIGYWTFGGDTTGQIIAQGTTQQIIVRVRFRPNANYGTYSSIWKTNEVDSIGDFIQMLDLDSTSLSLLDCSSFEADSSYSSYLLCFNDSNGTATVTATGGDIPYSYLWSNNQTTQTATNLTAGTYECTVTDLNGCVIYDTVTIYNPANTISTINVFNISCFGSNDGEVSITMLGGTTPPGTVSSLTYCSSNPAPAFINQPSTIISDVQLSGDNYNINNNTAGANDFYEDYTPSMYADITEGQNYTVNIQTGNLGGASYAAEAINVYIDFNIDGDFGDTGEDLGLINISNWTSGTIYPFNFTVPSTGAFGATRMRVVCMSNAGGGVTMGSCESPTGWDYPWFGATEDYSIVLNTPGLAATYLWENGSTSDSIINLGPGIYSVIITDIATGCGIQDSIVITEPNEITFSLIANNTTSITSFDGSINVTNISGGCTPFTYNWDNGQTTSTANNLGVGSYCLDISDCNGCIVSNCINVSEQCTFNTTLSSNNATCFGNNNGNATVIPTGGLAPYSYSWSDGQTTATAINLFAGLHVLTITDSLGCNTIDSITINEPNDLISSYIQTDVSCFGISNGSVIVNFVGGTIGTSVGDTNYILGWEGSPIPFYVPYPNNFFNTNLLPPPYNAIPAGIYPYSVTDLSGCSFYDTIIITEPDSLFTSYSTTNYNGFEISCNAFSDGEINTQINGGTPPFENYLNGILQSSLTAINLASGAYSDSIIDNNGCTSTSIITLNEPSELISTLSSENISCNGLCDGEIFSSNSGGIPPYYFAWSNGDTTFNTDSLCTGNYTLSVTDSNSCNENYSITITEPNIITTVIDSIFNISTYAGNDGYIYISLNGGSGQLSSSWTNNNGFSSNNQNITNLSSGFYYLEISDSNSCNYLDTIELTQPSSLWMSLDLAENTSCFDSCNGSINITTNGGDSSYTYTWVGPNGFTTNTDDLINICYGEYIIEVYDGITTIKDTFNIFQPQLITSNLIIDSIVCHNGFAQTEINVWGGTQPFIYNWSNGSNSYFTNFNFGSHSINVTDQNGCSISDSFILSNPDSIISTTNSSSTNCFGGNDGIVTINIVNGGSSVYNFSNDNGITFQNSSTFNNLSSGNYSFIISDTNGCLGFASTYIDEPEEIISNTNSIDASCYDACDGSVSVNTMGGTPPYSYSWTNGINNLCAGFYNVVITDSNNCIAINSVTVNEPNIILVNIWIDGDNLVATNGFSTYQWYAEDGNIIPGETSNIFNPTSNGEYYVLVNNGECEQASYSINYYINGINNLYKSIEIYPNPTNGWITIQGTNQINNITIINSLGNQLIKVENNKNDLSVIKLDLSTFTKGIYLIKIEQENQIINYKILLQ